MNGKLLLIITLAMAVSASAYAFVTSDTPPYAGTDRVDEYMIDDGVGETSLAWSASNPGDIEGLNQFNVIAGAEVVTDIRVSWGTGAGGGIGTVLIFDDPNNDGMPTDVGPGDLLASLPVVLGPGPGNPFVDYDIADTNVGNVGDSFFIGVCVLNAPPGDFPLSIDTSAPQGRSWVAGADANQMACDNPNASPGLPLTNLSGFSFNGNFLIRANATGIIPVEDGTWGAIKYEYR
jgi:hypothetical protein